MEQQNNDRVSSLSDQVSLLKSLTIDIGNEVREQNDLLDNMDNNFSNTGDLMGLSIRKISEMMGSTSSKHMLILAGFVVFVMTFLYWMMRAKY